MALKMWVKVKSLYMAHLPLMMNICTKYEEYPSGGRKVTDKMSAILKTTFSNSFSWMKILIKISLKFVPKGPINIIALVQMMAWGWPGDKPLSEPMMDILMTHICVTRPQWVNSLRPRRNGCYNADDIFKCIFRKENVCIPTKISLKFVPKGPINNIPALVQIMAWRRPGNKPFSEPMSIFVPMHICVTRPQWVKGSWYLVRSCEPYWRKSYGLKKYFSRLLMAKTNLRGSMCDFLTHWPLGNLNEI